MMGRVIGLEAKLVCCTGTVCPLEIELGGAWKYRTLKTDVCQGFPSVKRHCLHLGDLQLETNVFMAQ